MYIFESWPPEVGKVSFDSNEARFFAPSQMGGWTNSPYGISVPYDHGVSIERSTSYWTHIQEAGHLLGALVANHCEVSNAQKLATSFAQTVQGNNSWGTRQTTFFEQGFVTAVNQRQQPIETT